MVQGKVAHTTADHLLQCGDTRTRRAHGTCWLAVVDPVIGHERLLIRPRTTALPDIKTIYCKYHVLITVRDVSAN